MVDRDSSRSSEVKLTLCWPKNRQQSSSYVVVLPIVAPHLVCSTLAFNYEAELTSVS